MDAGGDDFVIVRSKRQKRPTFKQKLLEDSEESEDEFIPPSKKTKNQSKTKKKGSTLEITAPHTKDSKPTRVPIDETIFNRNTALAMALSVNTAPSSIHDTLCSNSPKQSQQVGGACPDDSDDYQPESKLPSSESESDEDFEPSPRKPKKLFKPKTVTKAKKRKARSVAVAEKVKVDGSTTTVKSVDLPPAVATSSRDLPGTKPPGSITSPCGTKPPGSITSPRGTKPPGSITSPRGTKPYATTSPRDLPGTTSPRDPPPGTKPVIGRKSISSTGTPVRARGDGGVRAGRPKWTPPGPAKVGKDCTILKSCSNGPVIRVGLSRKAPIKPLHTHSPLQTNLMQ